jgi:hypothetical protein
LTGRNRALANGARPRPQAVPSKRYLEIHSMSARMLTVARLTEARRLQDFLASFLSVPEYLVPPTSILREFTGRSAFRY